MFQHFLVIALRNFRKHRSSFLINLVGLSTGLACALIIFMWVQDERNMNAFHEKDERLYRVMENQDYTEGIMTTTSTPGLLAETLAEEVPEIEHAITMEWGDQLTLTHQGKNVTGEGIHVGKDFFHVFTYPLLIGSRDEVLADPGNIALSRKIAVALFGDIEDAVGKLVQLEHEGSFQISGVYEDMQPNSTYQFDFLMNWEKFKSENSWVLSWQSNGPGTIVTLREGADATKVSDKIAQFVKKRNEDTNVTLFLQRFSERYLYGRFEGGKQAGGRIEYVRLFSLIAVFILIIACINFMNLSTARAGRRAKEVGVKKTIGASRKSLSLQYLTESMLTALAALVLAIGIVRLVLPQFNVITEKSIKLSLAPELIWPLLGITCLTGLFAGSYPALYLSAFKPVRVLKGELKSSAGELIARKGLVVFQFVMSAVLITSVMVVYKQIQFVQSRNLGYEKDQLIYFSKNGKLEDQVDPFLTQLESVSGIADATIIGHDLIGRQNNTSGLQWEGKNPDELILFENVSVGYHALSTLGIELKEGRDFSKEYGTDTSKVIFNETAINIMGLTEPIGKTIRLWDRYDLEIIGVVRDFHFQSLRENIKPLFFRLAPGSTWNVMARLESGQEQQALAALKDVYEAYNPGFPFSHRFVDEEYAALYAAERRVSSLSRYFAGLAIIISCLGLFGLASFTGERRKKEIGIRKILGASSLSIVRLLTGEFSRLVVIAILIALPLSFLMLRNWLMQFAFKIDLNAWFFVLTGVLVICITWITVGVQALRASRVHPSECLNVE